MKLICGTSLVGGGGSLWELLMGTFCALSRKTIAETGKCLETGFFRLPAKPGDFRALPPGGVREQPENFVRSKCRAWGGLTFCRKKFPENPVFRVPG